MAMIKLVSPQGWDWDRPVAVPIKMSSRGLIGADRQNFIKSAGSDDFIKDFERVKFAKDEIPVHLIALGASEAYGANRNGDGFSADTCRKHHPTFVKFANFYNNHKNKPDQGHPRYGRVKASAWNEKMKRIELLLGVYGTKEAADRDGGLVDNTTLEKLASGDDIPVSMACRVPHDVCSWCEKKARTRDEYCTERTCAAGGCKDNLTRLLKVGGDLHHLHVMNPDPVWFDMSRVFRPADRIAYGAKADYLTKAASDSFEYTQYDIQAMWKAAEDATAPLDVILYQDGTTGQWSEKVAMQMRLAQGLAAVEPVEGRRDSAAYRAYSGSIQDPFPVDVLSWHGTEKCAVALGAMADRKIILHIRDYARLVDKPGLAKEAAAYLPGIYGRMLADDSLGRLLASRQYVSEKVASSRVQAVANLVRSEYSLEKKAVDDRTILSAIRYDRVSPKALLEKTASAGNPGAEQLARDYAAYKVAALTRIAANDPDFVLTARYAVRQNYTQ